MLHKGWVRRTAKKWIKEIRYVRQIRRLYPDIRLWGRKTGTLPKFLVIGAQRAGSTFMHNHLSKHTSAESSPIQKEAHYFDNNYYKKIKWYSKFFYELENKTEVKKNFETSPYYLYHPAVPERIATSLPEVKLLIVLRDPVERAISQYKWMVQIGLETRKATKAFRKEAGRLDLERSPAYLKKFKDPLYFEFDHIYRSYLRRSMYHIQLRRWLSHFPASQIRIVSSTTLFNHTQKVVCKISDFLNIEHHDHSCKDDINRNASRNDISVAADARNIAERCLDEVEEKTKAVLSPEMIIGDALDLR